MSTGVSKRLGQAGRLTLPGIEPIVYIRVLIT